MQAALATSEGPAIRLRAVTVRVVKRVAKRVADRVMTSHQRDEPAKTPATSTTALGAVWTADRSELASRLASDRTMTGLARLRPKAEA